MASDSSLRAVTTLFVEARTDKVVPGVPVAGKSTPKAQSEKAQEQPK